MDVVYREPLHAVVGEKAGAVDLMCEMSLLASKLTSCVKPKWFYNGNVLPVVNPSNNRAEDHLRGDYRLKTSQIGRKLVIRISTEVEFGQYRVLFLGKKSNEVTLTGRGNYNLPVDVVIKYL